MTPQAIDHELVADELIAPWLTCLLERSPGLRLFDCHTHVGVDLDGARLSLDALRRALQMVDARAVVFPLATARGYRGRNDRLLATTAGDHRLVTFCRVDPHADGAAEAERALRRGAAGIKLHPRAERFLLSEPEVDRIVAIADERRVPVIVHAGRGIPSLGRDALVLADRYPSVPLILAHSAVADLAWIWEPAADTPNLFFDTSWWNTADLLALFTLVAPGQILFASDAPYGRPVTAAAEALRVAFAVGLSAEQRAMVFGGQLARLLAHEAPADLGAAPSETAPGAAPDTSVSAPCVTVPGTSAPAPDPLFERLHTMLLAAGMRTATSQPADEFVDLARLACRVPDDHPHAPAAASVAELLERHRRYLATDPPAQGPRPPGVHFLFVAAAVARLPQTPLPTL